jgi:chromosome segregation ATPase
MAERDSLNEKANSLESDLAASRQEVAERNTSIASLQALIADYEQKLDLYAAELDAQEKAIVELQIDADNKRIELATRATEIEEFTGRISELSKIRKGLEENLRAASGEAKETREVVRAAVRKASDLEKRSEKLMTQLNDREERLARREAELMRLKESARLLQSEKSAAEQLAQSIERQRQTLAVQNLKLTQRTEKLASMATAGGTDKTMKKLHDDKTRLISMVEQLTGEKNELVERLKAATGSTNQDAALREQVHDLTARIVSVATEAEGPRSPVTKLLNTANESGSKVVNAESGEPESLADRIRALQKAASRSA